MRETHIRKAYNEDVVTHLESDVLAGDTIAFVLDETGVLKLFSLAYPLHRIKLDLEEDGSRIEVIGQLLLYMDMESSSST